MNTKSPNPFISLIGKIVFRKDASWLRRKKTILMLWTIAVGAIMGGILMVTVYLMSRRR